jgi:dolichol-phosphate mannosyltransferase
VLSLIVPTYNEAKALPDFVRDVRLALGDQKYEIIVVDDNSPDRTWLVAEHLHKKDVRIRVLRRMEERGLSSAVVAGFGMAKGDVLAVMDADGQHDAALLPELVRLVRSGADVAIASRYTQGGSADAFSGTRKFGSRLATAIARAAVPAAVTDPLSGFFVVRTARYHSMQTSCDRSVSKFFWKFSLLFLPERTFVKRHCSSALAHRERAKCG